MDIGKLETTPVDLNKLSDTVKNEVAKKTEYNELLKKVNNRKTTDGSGLVKKKLIIKTTDHDHDKYITTEELNKLT